MSQSLTALYLQNPELANALRRQQHGQALIQQGSDSSPIQHPFQGLARLAQALIGGYERGQGDKALALAGDKQQQAMAMALAPYPGAMPGMAPSVTAQTPQGETDPTMPVAQTRLTAPGAMPDDELTALVAPVAQKYGVPLPVALAMVKQESGGRPSAVGDGGRSVGLGQVQEATARAPGYGVPPMDPALRTDPRANVDFMLNYLTSKGRAAGATDFNNPEHQDIALRAYNGGGDPRYVQNVRQWMTPGQPPGGAATPVAGPAPASPPQQAPDLGSQYMQQSEYFQRQAAAAQAAGNHQAAAVLMQRAQMAQQFAMSRGQTPTESERMLQAAGLQPGTPEYQQMARQLLEAKARGQSVNVTTSGGTTYGTQPPADYRYVRKPTADGGETVSMEVIPGSKTDMALRDKEAKEGKRTETTVRAGNIVTEDIDRIGKLVATSTLPTAGPGASFLSGISGTGASDVSHLLEGIGANIAFDKLQDMRSSSPTGAALGAVSDKENAMLQSVYGSLKQSQSAPQFAENLARLKRIYMDIIHGAGKWTETAPDTPTPDVTPLSGPGGQRPPLDSFKAR